MLNLFKLPFDLKVSVGRKEAIFNQLPQNGSDYRSIFSVHEFP